MDGNNSTPVGEGETVAAALKLRKVLGMLGSEHAGERDAAAVTFTRLMREADYSPSEILFIPRSEGSGQDFFSLFPKHDPKDKLYEYKREVYYAAKQAIAAVRSDLEAQRDESFRSAMGIANEWKRAYRDAEFTSKQLRTAHGVAQAALVSRAEAAEAEVERLKARLAEIRELTAEPAEPGKDPTCN